MKSVLLSFVIGNVAVGLVAGQTATNYLGADAVLKKIAEGSAAATASTNAPDEITRLNQDTDALAAKIGGMAQREAAAAWLTLLDRYQSVSPQSLYRRGVPLQPFQFQKVMEALPPPSAWDALVAAIETRPKAENKQAVREIGLRLLGHVLVGNQVAQPKDIEALEAAVGQSKDPESQAQAYELESLMEAFMSASDDPKQIQKALERKFLIVQAAEEGEQEFSIPDLVTLVGAKDAEAFLRRALVAPAQVEVGVGDETRRLARKLALELIDKLKTPQWKLTCSIDPDAMQLYEALEKRFAKPKESASELSQLPASVRKQLSRRGFRNGYRFQQEPQAYYFLGLIAAGRTAEATALIKSANSLERASFFRYDALSALDKAGYTEKVHDFLREALTQNPDLPFWDEYIPLAARVGQTREMLTLVKKSLDRSGLDTDQRRTIRAHYYKALLASDQVDEGVKVLQDLLAEKPTGAQERSSDNRAEMAMQYVQIGLCLHREEWTEEGIRITSQIIAESSKLAGNYYNDSDPVKYANLLAELGRGPEAEKVLMEAIATQSRNLVDQQISYPGNQYARSPIAALAALYNRAGRHADVIALLEKAPWWGAKDVAELYTQQISTEPNHTYLGYVIADSLAAGGHSTEARPILATFLDSEGGFDPAYALLVKLDGAKAIASLDALFSRDQFEERPLIWKAHLLQQAGRLEEAEKCARQAIAIDPSDGEEGPGDRMRVYAVLADVLEARGDKAQATTYREAVKTIRLSEQADRFYEAGLVSRAVKMYEEALTHFADAYCVQSRLALRLTELGQLDAAAEHYRRAYELMPDSFGRMESHCFGCEGVFNGKRAQSAAEKVFTQLATKTPNKPQVHYLLGYLREQQERFPDALASFRAAVKLDPDYLNAWKHIQDLGDRMHLSKPDRNTAAFQLLRLDPRRVHAQASLETVTDLRTLWAAVEAASKLQTDPPRSLYPLTGSTAALETRRQSPRVGRFEEDPLQAYDIWSLMRDRNRLSPPGRVVSSNRLIGTILSLLQTQ